MLLKNSEIIRLRMNEDLGITTFNTLKYEIFEGNHYQEMLWLANDGGFQINLLQFCKRNFSIIPGKFLQKPKIGKFKKDQ